MLTRHLLVMRQVLVLLLFGSLISCAREVPSETKKGTETDRPVTELVEVTNKGIKGTYDQNSIRWIDDQLVIDLVLENPSAHDLSNLDVSISIGERRETYILSGALKKSVQLTNWRKGDKQRVVVPIINNDLFASSYPKEVKPSDDHDITGTAVFRKTTGSDTREYKIQFWGEVEGGIHTPKTALSGTGAVGQEPITINLGEGAGFQVYLKPTILTNSNQGKKGATLRLQRLQSELNKKLPALQNVKLLVVGYTDKVEQFRRMHTADAWPVGEELSIPIEPVQITTLKIRGVGRRHAQNADDVIQQQQVFYICENFEFSWKNP